MGRGLKPKVAVIWGLTTALLFGSGERGEHGDWLLCFLWERQGSQRERLESPVPLPTPQSSPFLGKLVSTKPAAVQWRYTATCWTLPVLIPSPQSATFLPQVPDLGVSWQPPHWLHTWELNKMESRPVSKSQSSSFLKKLRA